MQEFSDRLILCGYNLVAKFETELSIDEIVAKYDSDDPKKKRLRLSIISIMICKTYNSDNVHYTDEEKDFE